MVTRKCQVLVIGAGPGGYVAAIRAGQLGLKTIIVEGQRAGGTCLIRGCIPSKAMIHAAHRFHALEKHAHEGGHMGISIPSAAELDQSSLIAWKDEIVDRLNKGVEQLLKAAGVELITGWARFLDAKSIEVEAAGEKIRIAADNVIIATGSTPTELSFIPFSGDVISSREALDLKQLPQRLAVIGGGYIGLELGIAYAMFGSEVTVIEAMDSVLPQFDKELRRPVEMHLKKNKIKIHTKSMAQGVEATDEGTNLVSFTDAKGKQRTVEADKVLVTVGRRPRSDGLDSTGVDIDERGFIEVDSSCATNMSGVYAIGDVCSAGEMLAHVASAQGEMVAELISGHRGEYNPAAVPAIVFTEPEIVSVGMSPEQAREHAAAVGTEVISGKFPLAASGRALTMDAASAGGFVRVLARSDDHEILGIQAVGSGISEMSGEFVLALEMGAVLEDITGTIHAHPTLSEAFHEGVLATLGRAIHVS